MVEVWEDEKSEIEERFSFLGESFYANLTIVYSLILNVSKFSQIFIRISYYKLQSITSLNRISLDYMGHVKCSVS